MNRYATARPVSGPYLVLAAAPDAVWAGTNANLNNDDHRNAIGNAVRMTRGGEMP